MKRTRETKSYTPWVYEIKYGSNKLYQLLISVDTYWNHTLKETREKEKTNVTSDLTRCLIVTAIGNVEDPAAQQIIEYQHYTEYVTMYIPIAPSVSILNEHFMLPMFILVLYCSLTTTASIG